MNCKYRCVINSEGSYITLVLVDSELDAKGKTQENIQYYMLKAGERLVNASLPSWRPHAGTAGLIRPRWDGEAWTEGATAEEIAAWETEHPAPPPAEPTLESRLNATEAAILALMEG